jgi:O-antigen/teichoic acid export membrane protein
MVKLLGEGLASRDRTLLKATLWAGFQILLVASLAVTLGAITWLALGGGRWLKLDVDSKWLVAFVAALLLLAWQWVLVEVIRGLGELRWASLFGGGQSAGPLATFVFAALLIAMGSFWIPTAASALGLYALSLAVTMPGILLGLCIAWRRTTASLPEPVAGNRPNPFGTSMILLTSLPICASQLLGYLALAIDLPIAGVYCSSSDVALLGQARRLLLVMQLPGQMGVLAVLPMVARLFSERRLDELERLVRRAATLCTLAAAPAALLFVAVPGSVLSILFGEFYRNGALLLVALSIGQLVAVHNGLAGYVLIVAGRHRAVVFTNALAAALMCIAGPLAAAWGGVLWLSLVTTCILAMQNSLEWWLARRLLNIWTHFDWKLLLPTRSAQIV